MDELSAMLGELEDCTSCLGDDVAPTQLEADRQNRAILRRRKLHRMLVKNPELAEELGKFTIGGAFKSVGKGLTAPIKIAGKLATGDFKGALNTAVDPLGLKTLLRKGSHTVQDVTGALAAPGKLAAGLSGGLSLKCTPCNPEIGLALTGKILPEIQRVQKLLAKMELSRKATSEHHRKQQQRKWRKEVISLLKHIQECRCA